MDKKAALLEYKLSHRPMGVFQIRNTTNDKVFVDSSTNIPGKINRHKFALNMGSHASKSLQADWSEFGEAAFEFETIEPVEPRDFAFEPEKVKGGEVGTLRHHLEVRDHEGR